MMMWMMMRDDGMTVRMVLGALAHRAGVGEGVEGAFFSAGLPITAIFFKGVQLKALGWRSGVVC